MNRSKIEWTDYTWNPITGCTRGCSYCYARRMAYRLRGRCGYPEDEPFRVTFHPDRLHEPSKVKKPSKIFTCSMGELFDSDSSVVWVDVVLEEMRNNPHHTFQLLTKRPQVLGLFEFPDNLWLGVSQDGLYTSVSDIDYLRRFRDPLKFISFEPLLGDVHADLDNIDWIIIGAQTGQRAKQPRKEWIQSLAGQAIDKGIPIFIKNNVQMSDADRVQEWPEARFVV